MRRDRYPLKLPRGRKRAAERRAKEDGVSLKQWIAAAVAQKVGVVETAAEFFKKRTGKAKGEGMMRFLRKAKVEVLNDVSALEGCARRTDCRWHGFDAPKVE